MKDLSDILLEADVISYLLEQPQYTQDASRLVNQESFVNTLNKEAFSACVELSETKGTFTRMDVFRALKTKMVDGAQNILTMLPKRTFELSSACLELRELDVKRNLSDIAVNIERLIKDGADTNTIQSAISLDLDSLDSSSRTTDAVVSISDVYDSAMFELENNAGVAKFSGVDTGSRLLNYTTGGWQAGMIVIAARPSAGKTIVGLEHAKAGARAGTSVLFLSLEMPKESLMYRYISSEASEFTYSDLGAYRISKEDINKIKDSDAKNLKDLPIYFYDSDDRDINYLSMLIIAECRKKKIGMVVIDYMQLIRDNQIKDQSDFAQVSSVSTKIQKLTRKLNIPIIALSQLSRAVEGRNDKRPQLSDIRSSGNIEQDASIVIGLYRPHYYSALEAREQGKDLPRDSNGKVIIDTTLEMVVLKNRNGQTGSVVRHCDVLTNRVADSAEELFRFTQPELIYQDSQINSIPNNFDTTNVAPF
jgi:replicative DNA helicase